MVDQHTENITSFNYTIKAPLVLASIFNRILGSKCPIILCSISDTTPGSTSPIIRNRRYTTQVRDLQ